MFSSSTIGKIVQYWRELLLVVISILFGYFVLEVCYRAYQYVTLPKKLISLVSANLPKVADSAKGNRHTYVFDQYTGYLYSPNNEGLRGPPWNSHWKTNSHGHVSLTEYPMQKPTGEFRIAVIGDSFTANINNNVLWTDILQDQLNASPKWRAKTGKAFTRVINFGVDGFGMVQFAEMASHHIGKFSPDLVIVNFISDDILRRIRYLEPVLADTAVANQENVISEYVQRHYLSRINWFRPYPELLAAIGGKYFGLTTRIPIDATEIYAEEGNTRYSNLEEGVNASWLAVKDIIQIYPDAIFLQTPLYYDLTNEFESAPQLKGIVEKLQKRVPEANIVSMLPYMSKLLDGKRLKDRPDLAGKTLHEIAALPDERNLEVYRWFFIPDDIHYTDYGTKLYGYQVAGYLIENVGALKK